MEKKYSNGLGIASLILFLIGLAILGAGYINESLDGSEYSGFHIIFAIFLSAVPLLISGILAIINIYKYYSKKHINKCNRFFLILDWIIIVTIILPYISIVIYNFINTMAKMIYSF